MGMEKTMSPFELIKSISKVLSSKDNLSLAESNSKAKLAVDKLISRWFFPRTSTARPKVIRVLSKATTKTKKRQRNRLRVRDRKR